MRKHDKRTPAQRQADVLEAMAAKAEAQAPKRLNGFSAAYLRERATYYRAIAEGRASYGTPAPLAP